ncbi:MAG: hypothetical protein NZ700_13065 [Gemmataceae bacterium]|nr:hypothetical protein [Gemmataceae bacterium]MDW8264366.1 hypothetical protein [Gemmataceae bacterium]
MTSRRVVLWATLAVLATPWSALGFGWRSQPVVVSRSYYYAYYPVTWSYYYAIPVTYMPVAPAVAAVPACPAEPGLYAAPTAAPPSTPSPTPSRPATTSQKPAPVVRESTAYYQAFVAAPRDSAPIADDRCVVSFWNQASRDITLRIDNQTRVVPRGRGLTLELPRQFSWQVDGRPTVVERVPPGAGAYEIAVRY